MLNLIRFLSRHAFFIQFLLLEVFCFYLLIQNNYYQRARFINSSSHTIGSLYDSYNGMIEYFSLGETNQQLAAENAALKNRSTDAFLPLFGKNVVINDTVFQQHYVYSPGKIINKSTKLRNNYFTIDKGELHGVEVGMGVITANGILGIVNHTSTHYSSVMSMLHKDISISAKFKKNNYFGSLIWNGQNYRIGQLNDIPSHVEIAVGDTIVTSGYSAIFPENIPIGVVQSFELPDGDHFYTIEVAFLVDYKNVTYGYFIKNLFKLEQRQLEALNQTDD
jgi:rod shape-determining protein MreC